MTRPEALGVPGALWDEVLRALRRGETVVVAIDGPAGSGKTTLAARLAQALVANGVAVSTVHMDDLYDGWDQDLAELAVRLRSSIIDPWLDGRRVRYLAYDWATERFEGEMLLEPGGALILEGVGSASRMVRERADLTIWVEAGCDERLRRGMARDGEALRDRWLAWQAKEAAHFAADQTRESVDVRLET